MTVMTVAAVTCYHYYYTNTANVITTNAIANYHDQN